MAGVLLLGQADDFARRYWSRIVRARSTTAAGGCPWCSSSARAHSSAVSRSRTSRPQHSETRTTRRLTGTTSHGRWPPAGGELHDAESPGKPGSGHGGSCRTSPAVASLVSDHAGDAGEEIGRHCTLPVLEP